MGTARLIGPRRKRKREEPLTGVEVLDRSKGLLRKGLHPKGGSGEWGEDVGHPSVNLGQPLGKGWVVREDVSLDCDSP